MSKRLPSHNLNDTDDAILIWRFEDAPGEYTALSKHGGDEEWVAFIPARYARANLDFLEEGTSFGYAAVSKRRAYGGMIWIGAHA